jgi:hypothetical protein
MNQVQDDSPYYRPNPDYGTGIYRRGVRLTGRPGEVLAEVEDTHHGMRVLLRHDGMAVTDIHAETPRTPTNTCSGASLALKRLVGTPLAITQAGLYSSAEPSTHCTHLFDLAALAIAHALRGTTTRRYDITVPDEQPDGAICTIACNGSVVHNWLIRDQTIIAPREFAGQAVLRGFIPWAARQFSGDELEAALVFQKGFFVSRARRRLYSAASGRPIAANQHMHGVCFAYQAERVQAGVHTDSTRDFSLTPDDVLAFRDPA